MEVGPMYRLIWSDGDRFDYVRDEDKMLEQIRQRSEADAKGYQRFFEYSKKVISSVGPSISDANFFKEPAL